MPSETAAADYHAQHGQAQSRNRSLDCRHRGALSNAVGRVYARQRSRCCHIRKIEPLNRALKNAPAWLTGQRRSQSDTRSELNFEELDHSRNIAKFNPIFDWEENDVWAYAEAYGVPLNELYHQGYPSIGCEPCTRPVKEGENIRAGRWWWESKDSKECGLHK